MIRRPLKAGFPGALIAILAPLSAPAADTLTGAQVLRLAAEKEKQQDVLRAQYLYLDHVEVGPWKADGSLGKVTTTVDCAVFYLEGAPYRRAARFRGRPLTPAQEANEVAKLKMTMAQRRAAVLQSKRKFVVAGIRLDDIVRLLDHVLLREENLRGRKTWVIRSEAAKDAVGESKDDRFAGYLCRRERFALVSEKPRGAFHRQGANWRDPPVRAAHLLRIPEVRRGICSFFHTERQVGADLSLFGSRYSELEIDERLGYLGDTQQFDGE